jgi:alkylation response protein AidB-like acyl-CoA dehydrogenase
VHPDVRRMLMEHEAFIEGARAFATGRPSRAILHKSPDEKVREKASDYMALLTPVVKAYLTDKGFASANLGAAGAWRLGLHARHGA